MGKLFNVHRAAVVPLDSTAKRAPRAGSTARFDSSGLLVFTRQAAQKLGTVGITDEACISYSDKDNFLALGLPRADGRGTINIKRKSNGAVWFSARRINRIIGYKIKIKTRYSVHLQEGHVIIDLKPEDTDGTN